MGKTVKIFKKMLIALTVLIGLSLLSGYIYLRIKLPGNEMIFIPPSKQHIEKTFIEQYGDELESIAEFVLNQEDVYWFASYPDSLEINGETIETTTVFPSIDKLYNEGIDSIYAIGKDNVQFVVWSNYIANTLGIIYSKTGECGISGKDDVVFERFGDTNWYYFAYANDM